MQHNFIKKLSKLISQLHFYVTYTFINSYAIKYCVLFSEAKNSLILNLDDSELLKGDLSFSILSDKHQSLIALFVMMKSTAHLLFLYESWKFYYYI